MNSKYYVSYEAARLLKEKGYNEVTNAAWNGFFGEIRISPQIGGYRNLDYPDDIKIYSAPTKAEAIDWMESKGIIVELSYDDHPHKDFLHWEYFVYVNDKDGWLEAVVCSWEENNYYKTRLEAEEAAIIKALELL